MKIKLIVGFLAVGLLPIVTVSQSVKLESKLVTHTRKKPIQDHKKTFTINYPKIKAASPAVSRKIEALLSYERAFDFTLREELGEIQWLEKADYSVEYNADGMLVVELSIEGSGAYPDGSIRTVTVDIRNGTRVTPAISFKNQSGLIAEIKRAQQKEIGEAIAEIRKDPEFREPDPKTLFENVNFTAKNLDWFAVSETGVVFKYDYGFPHVIKALEPSGEFFFTWEQLKPYLRAGSLLARVANQYTGR
jgi:hypothetical protein